MVGGVPATEEGNDVEYRSSSRSPSQSDTSVLYSTSRLPSTSNNNQDASGSPSAGDDQKGSTTSSYFVSLSPAAAPSTKRKRRLRTSPSSLLPPLDISQQTIHHHLLRKSAAASRKSARVHTVPAMVLSANALSAVSSGPSKGKRPHSATSNNGNIAQKEPETAHGTKSLILSPLRQPMSPSERRKYLKAKDPLATPERLIKRSQINKIETVRVLRARPAFYPVKEKHPYSSSSSKSRLRAGVGELDLPHNILGKHITLRMDRAGDLRRKRRTVLPPATNLQQSLLE